MGGEKVIRGGERARSRRRRYVRTLNRRSPEYGLGGTGETNGSSPTHCKVRGAGVERSPERPFVVLQIHRDDRSEILGPGAPGRIRWTPASGELLGLRRGDILTDRSQVRGEVQAVEFKSGERIVTAPKTTAGRRTISIPSTVNLALTAHLVRFTRPGPDDAVFTGPLSEGLRRATFYTEWKKAMTSSGQAGLHPHDLRHAAGTVQNPSVSGVERYWRDNQPIDVEHTLLGNPKNSPLPGDLPRASDGNRTRVLSLGSPPRPISPPAGTCLQGPLTSTFASGG